jgi:ubiquinone/menaquinone biosynthesis C-methylase UbiE
MTEGETGYAAKDSVSLTDQETRLQYQSSLAFLARLRLYAYTRSYQDFFKSRAENPHLKGHVTDLHYREIEAIRSAGVDSDATVVSLACGDGSDALLWTEEYGHTGRVIGVNLDPIFDRGLWIAGDHKYDPVDINTLNVPMEELRRMRRQKNEIASLAPQIGFLQADASHTGLPDNCADALTINNLFHHVREETVTEIINEAIRITKPGGVIAIAGRGIRNMHKHWGFIPRIATALGARDHPKSFYNRFGMDELTEVMSRYFSPLSGLDYEQDEDMFIPAGQIDEYLVPFYVLASSIKYDPPRPPLDEQYLHPQYNPSPTEMRDVIMNVVMQELHDEINATATHTDEGYITDSVHQFFKIGLNNKHKPSVMS